MSAVGDARKRQAETAVAVPPGPCWADSRIILPGREYSVRCELRAGHAGAHEADRGSMGGYAVWTDEEVGDDEHADILAELAETQAALHAATNDVVRLAAELHTAHGQIDRARILADEWEADRGILSPDSRYTRDVLVRELRRALDGGAS